MNIERLDELLGNIIRIHLHLQKIQNTTASLKKPLRPEQVDDLSEWATYHDAMDRWTARQDKLGARKNKVGRSLRAQCDALYDECDALDVWFRHGDVQVRVLYNDERNRYTVQIMPWKADE